MCHCDHPLKNGGWTQFSADGEVMARLPWKGEILEQKTRQPQGLRALTANHKKAKLGKATSRPRGPVTPFPGDVLKVLSQEN